MRDRRECKFDINHFGPENEWKKSCQCLSLLSYAVGGRMQDYTSVLSDRFVNGLILCFLQIYGNLLSSPC